MRTEKADRLANNIAASPNMLSVRLIAALTVLWGLWSAIPKESQEYVIAALNIPTGWLPVIAAVGLYLTRIWPQPSLTAAPPAAPEEDAGEPTLPPSELPPVLTGEVGQVPVDEAIDKALRLIYGDRMAEREIERIKATTALVLNQVSQPPTKGTAP